jgi:hypothetical protein
VISGVKEVGGLEGRKEHGSDGCALGKKRDGKRWMKWVKISRETENESGWIEKGSGNVEPVARKLKEKKNYVDCQCRNDI